MNRSSRGMRPSWLALLLIAWGAPAYAGEPIAVDVAGDASESAADLLGVEVALERGELRIVARTAEPYGFPNTQVLMDMDGDAATGFADAGRGFDLLIEGENVFRFEGSDQSQWSWKPNGKARRAVAGKRLTLGLPVELQPKQDFDMVVRTLTAAYAEVDRVPDSGAMHIELATLAASLGEVRKADAAREDEGDAADASRDLIEFSCAQEDDRIVVRARTRAPSDFGQLLVFFETDRNAHTGYQSSAVIDAGFDRLLNGGRIHEFGGDQQNVWAWSGLDDAEVKVNGDRYEASFDAGLLGAKHAQVVAMMMSADWQTVVDLAPDDGEVELSIDVSKVKPRQPPPQVAAPRHNRDLPARERFAQAESFYCYYGSGKVAELSHYDIVIAHAPQMAASDIAELKRLGVVVIGYITVGEDDKLRTANGNGPGGYASWYLDEDGDSQPDQNGIWKSYYVNAGDPAWQADRIAEARRLQSEYGYDGIFLDTIDTASAFPQTKQGMVELIKALRAALPDAPIVLNQGFPLFAELAPMADGLMIESFTATYDFRTRQYVMHTPSSLDWTRGVAERVIGPVIKEHPLKVLVLDYAQPNDLESIQVAADRATTFGYLFAAAPIHLDAVYDTGIHGKRDPRWLEPQATPEALKYTLTQPANGFPAQTVLKPSGCYGGYKVAPLVDGVHDRESLYWADAAWASAEDGRDAWIELSFPQPIASGALRLQWAVDNGRLHASQNFRVEVRRGDKWTVVDQVAGNTKGITEHKLPDAPFDAVRVLQPAGGGSPQRPDLMWLAQVERLDHA